MNWIWQCITNTIGMVLPSQDSSSYYKYIYSNQYKDLFCNTFFQLLLPSIHFLNYFLQAVKSSCNSLDNWRIRLAVLSLIVCIIAEYAGTRSVWGWIECESISDTYFCMIYSWNKCTSFSSFSTYTFICDYYIALQQFIHTMWLRFNYYFDVQ